jgi:hypothetical protein
MNATLTVDRLPTLIESPNEVGMIAGIIKIAMINIDAIGKYLFFLVSIPHSK